MNIFDLKVGYACNNNCIHCVIKDEEKQLMDSGKPTDLSYPEIVSLLDAAIADGAKQVVLTGGEITIRKDCSDIITYCNSRNVKLAIQTNGRRLCDSSILNSLGMIDDVKLTVALHGSTASTHDKVTQRAGSFVETCKGIRSVREIGKTVVAKVVLSKNNLGELADIVNLCHELHVEHICLAYPHGHGAARENYPHLAFQYSELRPYLLSAVKRAEELGVCLQCEAVPCCVIPEKFILISEVLESLVDQSYFVPVGSEVLNWGEIKRQIKQKAASCSTCVFDLVCEGVWEEYLQYFGEKGLVPVVGTESERDAVYRAVAAARKDISCS